MRWTKKGTYAKSPLLDNCKDGAKIINIKKHTMIRKMRAMPKKTLKHVSK
jgi:hypothetical protein